MTPASPETAAFGPTPPRVRLDLEAAANALAQARMSGGARRVVLTNGGFDLLHVGHLRLLEAAAEWGDFLVVALNDDDSLRGLKGPDRPLVSLAERAELVAALRPVALVTSFHEPTVERVLRRLQPQVHAKGTDYTEDTLPEAAIDRELGIEMAFVGDPKNHGTTQLATRLRGSEVVR